MRRRMNWRVVRSNLEEAREQLESLEARAASSAKPSEAEMAIALEHAYHHLNFAWNARHVPDSMFRRLTNAQFNQWSRHPRELKPLKVAEVRPKLRRHTVKS